MKKYAYFAALSLCFTLSLGLLVNTAEAAQAKTTAPINKQTAKNAKAAPPKQEQKAAKTSKQQPRLPIMSKSYARPSQFVNYIRSVNPNIKVDCSIEELVSLYYREAEAEGVRADMALVQAITETGNFNFKGDAKHHQNNFCGLGVVGSGARGAHFKTPQDGVRAHIQHLMAYVSERPPKTKIIDPRYSSALSVRKKRGFITYWDQLAGTWAMDKKYYVKLYSIYSRVLKTKGDKDADQKLTKLADQMDKKELKKNKEREKAELKAKQEAAKKAKSVQENKQSSLLSTSSRSKKPVVSNEPLKK